MRPCDPVIEDGGDVMAACLLHCTTYRPQYICFSMKKMGTVFGTTVIYEGFVTAGLAQLVAQDQNVLQKVLQ